MVLTRRYWCGKTGLQLLLGSRGRNAGLIPPPPSSRVRSKSTPSEYSSAVPTVPGQRLAPPGIPFSVVCAGGESLRLKVTSYQIPVVPGEPPVISAARPGKESEIYGVDALV